MLLKDNCFHISNVAYDDVDHLFYESLFIESGFSNIQINIEQEYEKDTLLIVHFVNLKILESNSIY